MSQVATAPRTQATTKPVNTGRLAINIILYIILIAFTLLYLSPLLWMLVTAFKPDFEASAWPLNWIPQNPTTEAFNTILNSSQAPVFRWFLNSLIAASAQTLLILVTASLAAYPLARMKFPGKGFIFAIIVSTLFIPPVIFLIPNYLIVDKLGWLDTLWALIVPGAAGAFGVFFLRQFFMSLPYELEEAAFLDGANRLQTFWQVVIPLSGSALATLAVLSFLNNWNDFLWPVYVIFTPSNFTLQPGLSILQGAYTTHYPVIMAGGIFATIPVLILFIIAQRYVVEGVAQSGLKG
ncbi:MAG TPA: carbohydrate ABC transporter permease [Chloroflexia bacterium]|nr:carbohydrate ABC transporter permease [Chloroflexia bacterium]